MCVQYAVVVELAARSRGAAMAALKQSLIGVLIGI